MKKYLFIDRDGTLVKEPYDYQVDSLDKIELTPFVIESLLKLKAQGYTFVMVSNQDGLGTDSFPLDTFVKPHEFILKLFASQGIEFEQILICPHKPEDNCDCRKPKLGLLLSYLKDLSWSREDSYFIGDRSTDKEAGNNIGIKSLIVSEDFTWKQITETILSKKHRRASVSRNTKETKINLSIDLDKAGDNHFDTGIGFFDHMLDQIATHSGISITAVVQGDLNVDTHHTIEDTGIALGTALKEALGDKRGIARFGFVLPMDEVYAQVFALNTQDDNVEVALDISGRPYPNLDFHANFTREKVGKFESQMVEHFFQSLAVAMGLTLYMRVTEGNCHHQIEALFKAFGRALGQALKVTGTALPSSKGTL